MEISRAFRKSIGLRGSLLSLCALVLLVAPALAERDRFDTVVIDAGHGGDDEGAIGKTGLTEKEVVLDVAKRLAKRLRAAEIDVVLTRDSDIFVPLEARTSIANDARADLFVSIHANAARSRQPRGIETYFESLEASDEAASELAERENAAFGKSAAQGPAARVPAILGDLMHRDSMRESNEFAKLAHGELTAKTKGRARGVKQAPFVVLRGVQMPSVLVELGFLTNREDERSLRSQAQRAELAEALARAVLEFGTRYDARRGVASSARPMRSGS